MSGTRLNSNRPIRQNCVLMMPNRPPNQGYATTAFAPSYHGGEGTPLVLIHGFTGTWYSWEPILQRLETQHEVLPPPFRATPADPPLKVSLA